jgi:hypothetical protein
MKKNSKSTVKSTTNKSTRRSRQHLSNKELDEQSEGLAQKEVLKTTQAIKDTLNNQNTEKALRTRVELVEMALLLLSIPPGAGELAAAIYEGIGRAWDANRASFGEFCTDWREDVTLKHHTRLLATLRG